MIRPERNRRVQRRRESAPPPAWTPASIDGLVLWLDNSLITESGGLVTAWPDLSGAGNDRSQANPASQPAYLANDTTFPTPQPAVQFGTGPKYLGGSLIADLAWFAVVGYWPGSTFSAGTHPIVLTDSVRSAYIRGDTGTTSWRTDGLTADRYTDGVLTNTAFTSANQPHLWEFVPASPVSWDLVLNGNSAGSAGLWVKTMVLAATAVPDAPTRAALLAYCQGRGMLP